MPHNRVIVLIISLFVFVLTQQASGAAEMYFIHNDHLGTPQVVTDENQQVVWRGRQQPFGETTEEISAIEQNTRFPGQYFDEETGLHYNYFRDYDPTTGRYLQSDPIGILRDYSDPQMQVAIQMGLADLFGYGEFSLNHLYGYVDGNPINYHDPSGLAKFSFGFSGSFFFGGAGSNATGAIGFDTNGNICSVVTVCGRAGGGASTSVRVTASAGQGNFCPGDSASGGFFAGGGLGPFATVSTRTDGDANTTVSLGFGAGGGASGGGQVCITKTSCL